MSRDVVFVLGAGASADCGLPTMAGFGEKVRKLARSEKIPDDVRTDFSTIVEWFDDPKASIDDSFDPENVEDTFSLWQMEYEIGKPGAEDRLKALLNTIAYTYEQSYRWENWDPPKPRVPDTKGYVKLLRSLHKLYKDKWEHAPFSFITTNYDLALEDSWSSELRSEDMIAIREECYRQHYQHYYMSFDNKTIARIREVIEEGGSLPFLPIARYGLLNDPDLLDVQPLILKLQGSINWGICPMCGYFKEHHVHIDRQLDGPRVATPSYCHFHPETQWRSKDNSTEFRYRPLLIPPTWAKTSQSPIIRDLWRQAVQEIQEARCVVFIGYSLPETDMHMKCLLQSALMQRSEPPKIMVINKCCEPQARYEKALGIQFGINRAIYEEVPFHEATEKIRSFLQDTDCLGYG